MRLCLVAALTSKWLRLPKRLGEKPNGRRSLPPSSRTYSARSQDAPTNPRGIPYAPFVDKVDDYVSSRAEVEGTLRNFQEMISYAIHTAWARRCTGPCQLTVSA